MRHRETRDANEAEIVRTLEAIPGVRVHKLPNEAGLADLLVRRAQWWPGRWAMIEVKTSDGKLAPHQAEMVARGETIVARCARDVLIALDIITEGDRR